MDPSTQAAQDVQKDTSVNQPVQQTSSTVPQPTQPVQAPPLKKQISISGGGVEAEAGGGMVVQEDPDADNEEEETLKVAPQEKKTQVMMGLGNDEQDEDQQTASQASAVTAPEVEIAPSVPEVAVSSPEVEKVVEITPPETPRISQELKDLGITHSGPGIIDVAQINFKPKPIPVTFEQAVTEEVKIKNNRIHSSRFWLLQEIKYLWRKINPDIDETIKKPVQKTVPVTTSQSEASKNTNNG